ncbi:MAG TPA: nucleotide exchange factor GrpE [Gammaproteobacteria bacterium]|nr:nucleotide exchange factor GrpE [Gammaproteobacteria bacterium]
MQADEQVDDLVEDQAIDTENNADIEANIDQETDSSEEQTNSMEEELDAAKARAEESWNKVLLMQAEQDNMRKRSIRDVENAHKYALEKFVNELLPVVDSLEMGLAAADDNTESDKLREGTELTLKMFIDVLEKFDVEAVDPTGDKFNPDHHQAMSMQESADVEPNHVIATMQKGYLLNGRLVRPAMVMVAK